MTPILLTQNTTFIIGPVARLLGYVMDFIYNILDIIGIPNIGLAIILFTVIVNVLMLPMTIRQQRSQKLQSRMQPEIQAIQKKYKDKKDQVSMQKMQEETKMVYEKYGTSATGGCLPLLIQMPILFALYRVIMNIPAYVTSVKEMYMPLVDEIRAVDGFEEIMMSIGTEAPIQISADRYDYSLANTIIDVLYKFRTDTWDVLIENFPHLEELIISTSENVANINSFLTINLSEAPSANWRSVAILIPILAGLSQYISAQLSMRANESARSGNESADSMANSMKTMNTVMPLMSVAFCFTLPAGLGLYWIASAVVRSIIQLMINMSMRNIDVDEMIQKNVEKANKKREKKGLPAQTIRDQAKVSVKNIEEPKKQKTVEERKEEQKKAADYYNRDAKPGSLAAKANMVKKFNEGQKDK